MINPITGTAITVPADLVEMYVKAGFALASPPAKAQPAEPVKRPPAKKKSVKK